MLLARPAAASVQVELEVAVSGGGPLCGLDGLGAEGGAPQVGVEHDARGVYERRRPRTPESLRAAFDLCREVVESGGWSAPTYRLPGLREGLPYESQDGLSRIAIDQRLKPRVGCQPVDAGQGSVRGRQ